MKRLHHRDSPDMAFPRYVGKNREPVEYHGPEIPRMQAIRDYAHSLGIFTWHQPEWLLEAAFGRLSPAEAQQARESAEEIRGMPDIICFYKGHFLAIETKTELTKLSTSQRRWLGWIGTQVVREVDEGFRLLTEWKGAIDA